MAFTDFFWSTLGVLWPVLVIGVIVFVGWGASKAAAERAGYHLGVLGVGIVLLLLGAATWYIGQPAFAALLFFIGVVLIIAGLWGDSR